MNDHKNRLPHIVAESDEGWVLQMQQFVVASGPYTPLSSDYVVPRPYGVAAQSQQPTAHSDDSDKAERPRKRQRRKRKPEQSLTTGDRGSQQLQEMYEQRRPLIERALDKMVVGSELFCQHQQDDVLPPIVPDQLDLAAFGRLARMSSMEQFGGSTGDEHKKVFDPKLGTSIVELADLFEVELINSSSERPVSLRVVSDATEYTRRCQHPNPTVDSDTTQISDLVLDEYVLPENASAVVGDLSHLGGWMRRWNKSGRKFGYVLADPPWANRSAGRAGAYGQMRSEALVDVFARLPLFGLLTDDAVVGVWATNSQRVHKLIREKLFAKWQLHDAGELVWMKVTESGEPVVAAGNTHRSAMEVLLIGRRKLGDPSQRVVVSVPSRRHSRKPSVHDLLCRWRSASDQENSTSYASGGLELFSRCAVRGWTAWGDESLRHNSVRLLEKRN